MPVHEIEFFVDKQAAIYVARCDDLLSQGYDPWQAQRAVIDAWVIMFKWQLRGQTYRKAILGSPP